MWLDSIVSKKLLLDFLCSQILRFHGYSYVVRSKHDFCTWFWYLYQRIKSIKLTLVELVIFIATIPNIFWNPQIPYFKFFSNFFMINYFDLWLLMNNRRSSMYTGKNKTLSLLSCLIKALVDFRTFPSRNSDNIFYNFLFQAPCLNLMAFLSLQTFFLYPRLLNSSGCSIYIFL